MEGCAKYGSLRIELLLNGFEKSKNLSKLKLFV